ncbi:MAG: glycosyl hydrolase family 65 protein, partial [Desulfuromonadales bacterium]
GAKILVETARLWADLGFYSKRRGGRFCINGVTGPDEYNTVVDNNTFTNLLARENLWYAADTVRRMREENPDHYATLVHKTAFDPAEAQEWQKAADRMYIPYDEELGIHPQDDNFLDGKIWDLENTPRDKFPLLLHFHPLVIYRHQVIKQADVVLALFLLGNEFSADRKKRNFDYYDPLTTGDSSLSACIQAIVAAEIGDGKKAMKYTRYAMLMDLADNGGNVRDGVHIAAMGGTWMVMVYGFAGLRDYNGRITFDPRLPPSFKSLTFPLEIRGRILDVQVEAETTTYRLRTGSELTIFHQGQEITLHPGKPARMKIVPAAIG